MIITANVVVFNAMKLLLVFTIFLSSCVSSYEFAIVDERVLKNKIILYLDVDEKDSMNFAKFLIEIREDNNKNKMKWLRETSVFYYSNYKLVLMKNSKYFDSFAFLREYPFTIERITEEGEEEKVSLEFFFSAEEKKFMYKLIPEWKKPFREKYPFGRMCPIN